MRKYLVLCGKENAQALCTKQKVVVKEVLHRQKDGTLLQKDTDILLNRC